MGNIFGTGLLSTALTRRGDGPSGFHRITARYAARRKRALLLTPLLIGLSVLAIGHGREAVSKVSRRMIFAALQDPLSLFSGRSPGERRAGALLSTTTAAPHERVLSTVRDREPASDLPPGTDTPIFPAAPTATESSAPPGAQFPPAFGPPFSNTPFLFPGPPPGTFPPGGTPPGGTPPGGTPPGGTPPGEPPPGGPPETPPIIPIPEPATWTMMLLGLLAVGATMRLRAARRSQ